MFVFVLVLGDEGGRGSKGKLQNFQKLYKSNKLLVCWSEWEEYIRCYAPFNCWLIQDFNRFKNWHCLSLSFLSVSDEKEKFEPTVFRDTIVQGLNEAGNDLEAIAKFLDAAGSRLDYRRYADTLFDILVAGSMLGNLQSVWQRILMISLACFF